MPERCEEGAVGRDADPVNPSHTVLIALCGLSPAVITETVWALAHESPAILPDRVIVLTTGPGREAIRRDLLKARVWQRLRHTLEAPASRLRFSDTGDCIRLFPASDADGELEDILTAADNAAVGDFILETLRQFTENPDTRVVFSIAGGRKTMTALGALAMTLLGRPGDRLCHVLVNPPFDSPQLTPRYHFPDPGIAEYVDKEGTLRAAADARITLCDIPYVRTRTLFAEHLKSLPGTFSLLVARANQSMAAAPPQPRIALAPHAQRCEVNGRTVILATSEFILFWMLCERVRQGRGPVQGQAELSNHLGDFDSCISSTSMPEKLHWDSKPFEDDSYVRRLANRLRTKLEQVLGDDPSWPLLDPTPQRGHYGIRSPRRPSRSPAAPDPADHPALSGGRGPRHAPVRTPGGRRRQEGTRTHPPAASRVPASPATPPRDPANRKAAGLLGGHGLRQRCGGGALRDLP